MRPAVSFTSYLPSLPIDFLRWWFVEATVDLAKILIYIFRSAIHFLSIELIFKTFFQPWKNEYREGLVTFARFFGMGLKSLLLIFSLFFLVGLAIVEIAVFIIWLAIPILFLWGIYAGLFH